MKLSTLLVVLAIVAATVALPLSHENHAPRKPREARAQDKKEEPRGRVHTSIHEESGKGVVASVDGRGTVYKSEDGKRQVNVEGSWSKVLDGPQRGKPQHNAGVSFDFEW